MIWVLIIIGITRVSQTDWLSGPGQLGPVTQWGKAFYAYDSITYNITGQFSPRGINPDYTGWTKHIIDQGAGIQTFNSITYGDFDGDGDRDLVGVKGGLNKIVFYKNENDNFAPVTSYPAPGGGTYQVAIISADDINNDKMIDVVVSGGSGVVWFENLGGFNFSPHTITSGERWFNVTGDIDNDGDIDIIEGYYQAGVRVWKNDGLGTFTNTQTISKSVWRLRLGDLDGDGNLDLMIGDVYTTGKVLIYFNDGNGYFSPVSSANVSVSDGLWSRDFNNDGNEDILTGYSPIRWWENNGSGTSYTSHLVYSGSNYGDGCSAEDMDMDGKADIITGYQQVAFFKQNTPNSFTQYVIDGGSYSMHWVIPFFRGGCSPCVDILACAANYFLWYENKMINQFAANSYLESSILEAQCGAGQAGSWDYFGYEVCVPFGNALSFQFRAGNTAPDIIAFADWSTPVFAPVGERVRDSIKLALNHERLFQYRVNCKGTTDAPVVYEVWVTYECVAGVDEAGNRYSCSLQIEGNEICYSLPEKAKISISLYNIAGRLVKAIENREHGPGTYRVTIPDLNSGIYFVVFSNNDIKTTRKMVLIK